MKLWKIPCENCGEALSYSKVKPDVCEMLMAKNTLDYNFRQCKPSDEPRMKCICCGHNHGRWIASNAVLVSTTYSDP